ncbi:MAG TPA: YIP1 family protein [Chlamydiales bacterium]|jgi:hypothetical protein|nr:YIP1 family protein [Chlamydiales bacterium]
MNASFNPWLKIWVEPRATIARLLQESPDRGFWILAIIYGFSSSLNWFQSMMMGQRMGVALIFMMGMILSPLWGYLGFSIWSWVVHFTGKWLKGKGTFKEVRFAYAWSCFPLIVNVVLWFLLAALYGRSLFANFAPESQVLSNREVGILFVILLFRITSAVWSLVIYLNVLAQVRQYSVLRAIGNVLIAGLIIAAVFYSMIWVGYSAFGAALPNLSTYMLKP